MALLAFLHRRRVKLDQRGEQERAVTTGTIDAAALKAQAESIVRDIRMNLDHLDVLIDELEPT